MPMVRVVQPMGDGGAGDVTAPGSSDVDSDVSGLLLGLLEDRGKRNSIEVGGGDCEGAGGYVPADGEANDADCEGAAGEAPGVGAAGDADGERAAGDVMVDGAAGDALMVRVLQQMLRL